MISCFCFTVNCFLAQYSTLESFSNGISALQKKDSLSFLSLKTNYNSLKASNVNGTYLS